MLQNLFRVINVIASNAYIVTTLDEKSVILLLSLKDLLFLVDGMAIVTKYFFDLITL